MAAGTLVDVAWEIVLTDDRTDEEVVLYRYRSTISKERLAKEFAAAVRLHGLEVAAGEVDQGRVWLREVASAPQT